MANIDIESLTPDEMADLMKGCVALLPLETIVEVLCSTLDNDEREEVAQQLGDYEDSDENIDPGDEGEE